MMEQPNPMEVLMKTQRSVTAVIIVLLWGLVLPLVAQSDPVFLGTLSEPFTTVSVAGELSHPGELNWYTFDVTNNDSRIYVLSEGEDDGYGIRTLLFDDEGVYIDATEDQVLEATLAAGTYQIRIDSIGTDVQSYSLVVSNGAEAESNDGILESNDLGNIAGEVLLIGSLLPRGDADFFRFEIPEGGLSGEDNGLLVETKGRSAGDTVLILYRYSDPERRYLPIAFDDDSGDGYWSRLLLHPQPLDRYAVRVEETAYPLDGIDEYGLLITPLALNVDDEPNDTPAQAVVLMPISPDAVAWMIDGLLDASDTIDFYELTIETPALMQLWTGSQPDAGDFDTLLTLYTHSGDRLAENDNSGDSFWSRIAISLDAGSYYVTVEASDLEASLVPYRLRGAAQGWKSASESEPNDEVDTAELIEWVEGEALLVEAVIGLNGDIDSFRFVLSEETTVAFETGPRSGSTMDYDTTLALYDEDLAVIAYNDDANGSWSRIEQTLPAGTYFIVVEGYFSDESFEYTLLITVP
jgi:hypothetical protein